MKLLSKKSQKGFTLIELLVVIGILAVLLSIVLIAINPARQFSLANNTQRRSDVSAVLNAIYQYAADNKGKLPDGTPAAGSSAPISSATGGTGAAFCNALVPLYIAALPVDPLNGSFTDCTTYDTKYTASASAGGTGGTSRVTISATGELQAVISVTR